MSNLEDLYREVILDHYRTPRNKGELPPPATCTEGTNPLCGDEIKIFLNVADGIVQDVRFSGHGCSISQASASMMTAIVKGRSLADVRADSKARPNFGDFLVGIAHAAVYAGFAGGPVGAKAVTGFIAASHQH